MKLDIAALRREDPGALAVVLTVLQEASADPGMLSQLTGKGEVNVGNHHLNVKPWIAARNAGNNLLRFRVLNTVATKYRVIYGYDWRTQRIGALAIVDKDLFNYELTDPLASRIISDWRNATGGHDT